MDPISAITARVSAIESRVLTGPSPSGGSFSDLLRAELAQRESDAVLGYSATGSTPGAGLAASYVSSTSPSTLNIGAIDALTPAERLEPGEYGSLTPPTELIAYGNGQVPSEALVDLSVENHALYAPAAAAFEKMLAAARDDGITIGVTDSYRTLATQERLAVEKGLYSEGGLAAAPGTSNHGWGVATDLDLDEDALAWMRENGPDYGYVEDVPREPWHWTYRPA